MTEPIAERMRELEGHKDADIMNVVGRALAQVPHKAINLTVAGDGTLLFTLFQGSRRVEVWIECDE
jgi:hypothetical protein